MRKETIVKNYKKHMSKKGLLALICLTIATTTFAEKIVLKPNWNKGDSMFYSVVNYTDTTKTISCDMTIKVLDNSDDYLMSCVYSNYQDYTGMEKMASMLIGEEKFDKIKAYSPHYTVSKEGGILKINNFDEYQKIFESAKDTSEGFSSIMNGLMSSAIKNLFASDEKSFMEISLKEVVAQHKYFGKEYNTEKETKGTTDITVNAIKMANAKSSTKVEKRGDKTTITTTAKLNEKESQSAIQQWMENFMKETARESGMDTDDPKMKKEIKKAAKEYKKAKIWAELEETAIYDTKTGWMISYESKETFHSTEGDTFQRTIISLK